MRALLAAAAAAVVVLFIPPDKFAFWNHQLRSLAKAVWGFGPVVVTAKCGAEAGVLLVGVCGELGERASEGGRSYLRAVLYC